MRKKSDKSQLAEASDLNHASYVDGDNYYKQGSYTQAKHAFEVSLEYWPEDPEAWLALGNCFDELKKPLKAENCYKKSLSYAKEKMKQDVYYNLGNSLYDQAKFDEAISCYKKVTAQSTTYRIAQLNLARAKNKLSNRVHN